MAAHAEHLPERCTGGRCSMVPEYTHQASAFSAWTAFLPAGETSQLPDPSDKYLLTTTFNPRGRCLSKASFGSGVEISVCLSLPPGGKQEFTIDASSRIKTKSSTGRDVCLTVDPTIRTPGGVPFLSDCTPDPSIQVWKQDTQGVLHSPHFTSGLCLKVDGTQLITASCAPTVATAWTTRKCAPAENACKVHVPPCLSGCTHCVMPNYARASSSHSLSKDYQVCLSD